MFIRQMNGCELYFYKEILEIKERGFDKRSIYKYTMMAYEIKSVTSYKMQNNNERICLLGKNLKMSISESFRLKLKFFFCNMALT